MNRYLFKSNHKEIDNIKFEMEVNKRVEELINVRLMLELKKSEELIENEVKKRVCVAKKNLEKEMLEELERLKQIEYKKQIEKEVKKFSIFSFSFKFI